MQTCFQLIWVNTEEHVAASYSKSRFTFVRNHQIVPLWFPPAMNGSSYFSMSSPAFEFISILDFGHSNKCVLVAQTVINPPAMQETCVWSLGQEDPPEKGMATHSSILAWRILWTEEPGGLLSMGSQRVRHNWIFFCIVIYYNVKEQLYYHCKLRDLFRWG